MSEIPMRPTESTINAQTSVPQTETGIGNQSLPPEGQQTEKKYGKEDVLAAGDTKAVLEAYSKALKNSTDRADLQSTVGEKLLQLGDTKEGMQFILLAEQTRNTDRMTQVMEMYANVTRGFENTVDDMKGYTEGFDKAVNNMAEPVTMFNSASRRLEESAEQILRAANTMSNSSGRF